MLWRMGRAVALLGRRVQLWARNGGGGGTIRCSADGSFLGRGDSDGRAALERWLRLLRPVRRLDCPAPLEPRVSQNLLAAPSVHDAASRHCTPAAAAAR